MSACWDLEIPATQKIVLISLADQANDSGVCWPALSTLMRRTGLSERAIQNAFKWLEQCGVLSIKRATGKSNMFTISPTGFTANPRTTCTPAADAPPHHVHHAPAADAGDPRTTCTQTQKNRNRTINTNTAHTTVTLAEMTGEGVDPQHAADFLAVRKAKRAPLTATAWTDLKTQAAKAGISAAQAVHICAIKGWQGFNAGWSWQDVFGNPKRAKTRTPSAAEIRLYRSSPRLMDPEARAAVEAHLGVQSIDPLNVIEMEAPRANAISMD